MSIVPTASDFVIDIFLSVTQLDTRVTDARRQQLYYILNVRVPILQEIFKVSWDSQKTRKLKKMSTEMLRLLNQEQGNFI